MQNISFDLKANRAPWTLCCSLPSISHPHTVAAKVEKRSTLNADGFCEMGGLRFLWSSSANLRWWAKFIVTVFVWICVCLLIEKKKKIAINEAHARNRTYSGFELLQNAKVQFQFFSTPKNVFCLITKWVSSFYSASVVFLFINLLFKWSRELNWSKFYGNVVEKWKNNLFK